MNLFKRLVNAFNHHRLSYYDWKLNNLNMNDGELDVVNCIKTLTPLLKYGSNRELEAPDFVDVKAEFGCANLATLQEVVKEAGYAFLSQGNLRGITLHIPSTQERVLAAWLFSKDADVQENLKLINKYLLEIAEHLDDTDPTSIRKLTLLTRELIELARVLCRY